MRATPVMGPEVSGDCVTSRKGARYSMGATCDQSAHSMNQCGQSATSMEDCLVCWKPGICDRSAHSLAGCDQFAGSPEAWGLEGHGVAVRCGASGRQGLGVWG